MHFCFFYKEKKAASTYLTRSHIPVPVTQKIRWQWLSWNWDCLYKLSRWLGLLRNLAGRLRRSLSWRGYAPFMGVLLLRGSNLHKCVVCHPLSEY